MFLTVKKFGKSVEDCPEKLAVLRVRSLGF